MSFLNPTLFLVGLACVALPIAIHILMRRRRKPVPWAAMRFLLEAYRQQRKRTRLEQLLLLASRCLLVAVLALALGRPALQGSGLFAAAGPRTLVLVLDNALTSSVSTTDRATELDALKARAESLLGELSASRGDAAALITTGSPAAAVISPPSADLAGIIDALRRVTPTDSTSDLPAALTLARQLAAEPGTTIALLSPWRSGSADTAKPLPTLDLPDAVRLVATPPAERPVSNITLTDATPVRSILIAPEGDQAPASTQVRVNLRRSGELPAATSSVEVRAVGLSGNASAPASAPVVWATGQTAAAVAINLAVPLDLIRQGPSIAILAKLAAPTPANSTDRSDALAADNVVVRPLVARRQVKVVILASRNQPSADRPDLFSPADWLTLALAPTQTALDRRSAEIEVVTVDPASASAASDILGADAIFVAAPDRLDEPSLQSLRRVLDAGRLLVIMPAAGTGVATWTDRLSAALALPWTIAKEPKDLDPPATLAPPASTDTGLFALLSPELPDLIKPVRVARILTVQPASQSSGDLSRTLLALSDGTPLLLAAAPASDSSRGPVLFLATAPELTWTNLPAMPLMLPIMQEILRQGLGESSGATRTYAGRATTPPRDATQFRRVELAPGLEGFSRADAEYAPPAPASHAGLFRTVDSAGRTLGLLAINPDPDAGRVDPAAAADLERWLSPLAANGKFTWLDATKPTPATQSGTQAAPTTLAASDDSSTPMDLWLLLAAAALGIAELFLAKRFSNANASARSPGLSSTLPTATNTIEPSA